MATEDYTSKTVWFLAGAATGAAIALLFAPATGEHTRRFIVKKTNASRDAIAESGKDVLERGRELFDKGRQLADEAAEMFERGRKLVESTADSLKS